MDSTQLRLRITGSLRQSLRARARLLVFWATAATGVHARIRRPWLDRPTRLFGGIASAYCVDVRLVNLRPVLGPLHALLRLAPAAGLVATAAVAAVVRELLEYLSDRFLGSHLRLGVSDTVSDLCFGLLGGSCFVAVGRARSGPRALASDV